MKNKFWLNLMNVEFSKSTVKKFFMYSGTFFLILALTLATILYGWQLALIIILALWGNNLERFADKL